ncbi:MAG: DUF1848 domain-containing protein [Erysipelotrichales bacterium]|nr:DUF1848 domain-containing protein [Erysipelotrichales bacterium]
MILFVSGRTDVVAFYSSWFMKRYNEGFVDVRNPFNPKLVSRINFSDVDVIVFCTKNPLPIIDDLKTIDKPIIFHVTLTPYKNDIEPNVPNKELIIAAIKKLSDIVGIDNLYIRYDPIFINEQYTIEYHKKAFAKMIKLLDGYVKHIIVSFIDDYKNVRNNMSILKIKDLSDYDYEEIGKSFSESAKEHGMTVQTCFEDRNLVEYGFIQGDCMPKELAFKLTGKRFPKWKARNCNCVEMVDIGVYNSCKHFCKYCYANYNEQLVNKNRSEHDSNSSLLVGHLNEDDVIKRRS